MKKKILMVGSSLDVRGGMTTVTEGFLNHKFINFDLCYIPTHTQKSRIKQILFYGISLFKVIICLIINNVSIVHIHFSERGSFIRKNIIMNISKLFKKKVIIHMHGAEFKEYYNSCIPRKKDKIKHFLLSADKVIVLGENWNEFVKTIDKNINTDIIPNFVECVDESAVYNTNDVNILFLAVLIKRKGIYELVEAVNQLIKEKNETSCNINVIVAGSGIEEQKLKKLVRDLKIDDKFEFKGWVNKEQKIDILKKSQIFVLPSYNEGLPVSILEAMSYGLPIISTNVGSIEDAVKDNYNGIIVNPGNVSELKNAIHKLMKDKNLWNIFSQNSKYLVEQNYNQNIYFKKVEKIYIDMNN